MKYHLTLTIFPDDGRGASRHGGVCKGVYLLLGGVDELGSLYSSARRMGMAYSKAWALLKSVEDDFGEQLVERHGPHGSVLTEFGSKMLVEYKEALAEAKGAVKWREC